MFAVSRLQQPVCQLVRILHNCFLRFLLFDSPVKFFLLESNLCIPPLRIISRLVLRFFHRFFILADQFFPVCFCLFLILFLNLHQFCLFPVCKGWCNIPYICIFRKHFLPYYVGHFIHICMVWVLHHWLRHIQYRPDLHQLIRRMRYFCSKQLRMLSGKLLIQRIYGYSIVSQFHLSEIFLPECVITTHCSKVLLVLI